MNAPDTLSLHAWVKEFPGAVTVCDAQGIILEMNDRATEMFAADGGKALIGTNLLECHPEAAREMLEGMLVSQEKNVYTIEKAGVKTLIYQTPWYLVGRFAGFIEMALEIPFEFPHYLRTEQAE